MEKKALKVLNKTNFVKALESISKISDSVILNIKNEITSKITGIVSSSDNTMIVYCEIDDIEATYSGNLNIPDVKKLLRALDSIPTNEIILNINSNSIEYSGQLSRFKYHMYEDGFLVAPSINISKVLGFDYDISFILKKETLQSLNRGSAFATDTNKLYLYTTDGRLKGELTDRSRHNTDVYELDLGEVEFNLSPLPLNLDSIKQLTLLSENINFGINTKFGVTIIDITDKSIKLKYILTSLTQ